jgi:hypothetical protein
MESMKLNQDDFLMYYEKIQNPKTQASCTNQNPLPFYAEIYIPSNGFNHVLFRFMSNYTKNQINLIRTICLLGEEIEDILYYTCEEFQGFCQNIQKK